MNKNTTFSINSNEKIIIEHNACINDLSCYCEIPIILLCKNGSYIVSIDNMHDTLLVFAEQLYKVLYNMLPIHNSIQTSIGYIYNEYLQNTYNKKGMYTSNLVYTLQDGIESWIGNEYKLWGYGSIVSWLYNDANGSIIFEVTPVYPGGFGNPERKAKANVAYKEWLITYKPYYIGEISHATAQQWLKQAQAILNQIEKNIQLI